MDIEINIKCSADVKAKKVTLEMDYTNFLEIALMIAGYAHYEEENNWTVSAMKSWKFFETLRRFNQSIESDMLGKKIE